MKFSVAFGASLPSLSSLYKSSEWLERELWDMFGIKFFLHGDLRRLLTDYGFQGHPLCKNFPLLGYFEAFYDNVRQAVVFEYVESSQDFRKFSFDGSWFRWRS